MNINGMPDWRDRMQDRLEDWKGNSILAGTVASLTYVFFFL